MRRSKLAVLAVLAVLAAVLSPPGGAQAQPAPDPGETAYDRTVWLVDRSIRSVRIDDAELARARSSGRSTHAVVQLHRLPASGDLQRLQELGITPLAYLNGRNGLGTAYLAGLSRTVADPQQLAGLVRGVHPLLPRDKIDPELGRRAGASDVVISFFADVSDAEATAVLTAALVSARRTSTNTFEASLSSGQVQRLATEDIVQFLAPAAELGQLELTNSRTLSNIDPLQQLDVPSGTYFGLSGLGVEVSVHDNGIDNAHGDFANRIIRAQAMSGDHGTHVASIVAGSGAMSDQNDDGGTANNGTALQWRGVAPQARITTTGTQTAHDAGTMTTAIVTDGADVSNHSYAYNSGEYDGNMQAIDRIIRGDEPGIPARPMVFSAGNGGTAGQFSPNSGYFALTKGCKNCLMVANLQNNGALNGGSSQGPTPDGRLKPDLGANGTSVTAAGASVDANGNSTPATGNSYKVKGGTSMATPVVTGTIALMLQSYAQTFGVDLNTTRPRPATLKALLLQGAVDQAGTASGTNPDTGNATVYGPGPDWATGYGLLDAQSSVGLIATKRFVEDDISVVNHTDEHLVSVVPGQSELKVTLAWDDLPGTPNANHAAASLVNDLDLLLVGPQGQVVRPLVLPAATQFDCDGDSTNGTQTGTAGCTNPDPGPWPSTTTAIDAAPGTDRLNNLEQVVVANPPAGLWRARVSVLNTDTSIRLPMGTGQTYSLAGVTADRADLTVSKTDSPDPAIAGEQLYYGVQVRNDGPATARDATVVDVLPAGVSYVTNTLPGGCVEDPVRTLTCSLGDLQSGQTTSFTIKVAIDPGLVADNGGTLSIFNTASAASTTPDSDSSDNTVTIGTIVEDSADLGVSKICKPDRHLQAGQTGTCTIYVDNAGPSHARDVVLRDSNLSDGAFTFGAVTSSQGTCTTSGGVITCELGTLPAASPTEPGRATVTVEVSANEEVDINDVADVRAATPDPNTANNVAEGQIHVSAVSDLTLTKSGPATAVAGTDVDYLLSIVNDGPSTARGVVIDDVAPAGVQILSVTGSDGATCNAGTPGNAALPSRCSFGDLAPGATRTMSVSVRVLPDTLGPIHNDARVSSDTFDDDLADNLATVRIDVEGVADLALSKLGSPGPVVAGRQLTYTMTVSNAGPSTAQSVSVSDELPAGTSFVSGVDGNGATVCALVQPGTVVCDLGSMQPNTSRTVYLTVLVAPSVPDGTVLTNSATISSVTSDPNQSDNTAVAPTSVSTEADLWLDKQAEKRSGNPSAVVGYSLVVHNDSGCETDAQSSPTPTCGDGGPSDALGITVTDTLPLDPKKVVVQYVSPQCTYTKATHTVTCTTDRVPAGALVTFVIEAQISGSVGTITNTADVTSTTVDPSASNNTNAATLVMKGGTGKK